MRHTCEERSIEFAVTSAVTVVINDVGNDAEGLSTTELPHLESDGAKHLPRSESAVDRSTILDGVTTDLQ